MPAPLQLTRGGVVNRLAADDLARLHAELRERAMIFLPGFVEPALLSWVMSEITPDKFVDRTRPDSPYKALVIRDADIGNKMNFLVNDPALLKVVEELVGEGPVLRAFGYFHKWDPRLGHSLGWHDDLEEELEDDRVASVTINFSARPYEGAALEIKRLPSESVIARFSNTGLGDAVILRLAKGLAHRNAPITGEEPKVSFAAFFSVAKKGRRS